MIEMVEVALNKDSRKDGEQQLRGGNETKFCEQLMCITSCYGFWPFVVGRGVIAVRAWSEREKVWL